MDSKSAKLYSQVHFPPSNSPKSKLIITQGNICCKGYHKDPEATEKLFAGGVLHSGDLAVCHSDGAIQILDRAKDIIISGKAYNIPFPRYIR